MKGQGKQTIFEWVVERLLGREDSEHEQALIRLGISTLLLLLASSSWFQAHSLPWPLGLSPLLGAAGYLFLALSILGLVIAFPAPSTARRYAGAAADIGVATLFIATAGSAGLLLLPVYLLAIIGNGFRYGTQALVVSTTLSVLGLFSHYFTSDYWRAQPALVIAMIMLVLFAGAGCGFMLRRLTQAMAHTRESDKSRVQLAATANAELGLPLRSVLHLSEVLSQSGLNSGQTEILSDLTANAEHAFDRLAALYDLSPSAAGVIPDRPRDFDLHAMLNEIGELFPRTEAGYKTGLTNHIAPETPFRLHGDSGKLRQVLTSALNWMATHKRHGPIELYLHPVRIGPSDCVIRVEVIDRNCGLPISAIDSLHHHLVRQSDESGSQLDFEAAVISSMVARLRGSCGMTPQQNGETLLWFELPFQLRSEAEHTLDGGELSDTHALLLCGERLFAVLETTLRDWGVSFERAASSTELASRLRTASDRELPYRVALIDQSELDVPSDHLARQLRSDPALGALSLVLIYTGPVSDVGEQLQAGFSSVLQQPVDKTLLFNALHAAGASSELTPENVVSLADHYQQKSSNRKLRIFLAESDPKQRLQIEEMLQRVGHEVLTRTNGSDALDELTLGHHDFDAILLAFDLSGKSGLEVLKAYRFLDTADEIPVIILCDQQSGPMEAACLRAGARSCLTKPVDSNGLFAALGEGLVGAAESADLASAAKPAERPAEQPLLVQQALEDLAKLGGGVSFVSDLVKGFRKDGDRLIGRLISAVADKDYRVYRETLHAIRGSSSELGCTRLSQACEEAGQLKPFEIESDQTQDNLRHIIETYQSTCAALADYLEKRMTAP